MLKSTLRKLIDRFENLKLIEVVRAFGFDPLDLRKGILGEVPSCAVTTKPILTARAFRWRTRRPAPLRAARATALRA